MSALGLQRALGLDCYETTWTWLHKLRRAMVRPWSDRLAGEIEVDETRHWRPRRRQAGSQDREKVHRCGRDREKWSCHRTHPTETRQGCFRRKPSKLHSRDRGAKRFTQSCHALIKSPCCSSAVRSALFKAAFSINISITTSMNSRFVSIAVDQTTADYSSTVWLGKPLPSALRDTVPLFTASRQDVREGDPQFLRNIYSALFGRRHKRPTRQ
jgi:hypothetical protein